MNRPHFLEEYKKLKLSFPFINTVGFGNDTCENGDNIFNSSNCHYVFESADMKECMYCSNGFKETNDVDSDFGLNGEWNCECLDFADCNSCYGVQSSARCYNVWHSWYMDDCHDCFGCANLSNKSYCIYNIQHTEEEYARLLPELKKLPYEEVQKKLKEVIYKIPQMNAEHVDDTNSDYCDYSYFNNNCYYCFDSAHNEDCGYLTGSYECKNSWNCSHVVRGENLGECGYSSDLYNCYEVSDCSRCYDCYFLEDCSDCHDCFGCVKLSHKSYCILNVQYTKEEYLNKIASIKAEFHLKFPQENLSAN